MDNEYKQLRYGSIKKIGVVFCIFFILLMGFIWIYTHSFIQVVVQTADNDEVSYELVDQKTNKNTVIKSGSKNIKKLVKKGSYEVLVRQGESSFIAMVSTKPLLKKTSVDVQLKGERSREFIGDNPGPCMFYDKTLLITYGCGSTLQSLEAHIPATSESPTVSKKLSAPFTEAVVGGVINYKNEKMILLGGVPSGEGDDIPNRLYRLDGELILGEYFILPGLDPEKTYSIKEYGQKFIVYDSGFENIFLYESPVAAPTKIDFGEPQDTSLSAKRLVVDESRIAVIFSADGLELDYEEEGVSSKGKVEIKIYSPENIKTVSFDGVFGSIELCAKKYMCLINDRELTLYDVNGVEPKEVFNIDNVYSLVDKNERLIVARFDGVFEFDIQTKTGFMQYSYGSYVPCGLQNVYDGGYVLCIISPENTKTALYINPSKLNIDSVDKKVLDFIDRPFISNISVYKSFFFISPDLGEFIYDSRSDNFIYDPEIIKKTSEDIDSVVRDSGLKELEYTIITNLP